MDSLTDHKFVTDSNFNSVVGQHDCLILVEFFIEGSAKCFFLDSILKEVFKQFQNEISILKIDYQKNNKSVTAFNVQEIPTILFFHKGHLLNRMTKPFSIKDVIILIQSLLNRIENLSTKKVENINFKI